MKKRKTKEQKEDLTDLLSSKDVIDYYNFDRRDKTQIKTAFQEKIKNPKRMMVILNGSKLPSLEESKLLAALIREKSKEREKIANAFYNNH